MSQYTDVPSDQVIDKTVAALKANGIEVYVVANGAEAKKKALEIIPQDSEVFTATSVTVDSIGLGDELNNSGRYQSVKTSLAALDPKTQGRERRKLGSAPDVTVGSVHAVTESGSIVAASMSGSQLPSYINGSGTLVWVVGAQKIVKDLDAAVKRIDEHIVPLESARARKAYGLPDTFNSFPAKMVVINRELTPGRVKLILVKEAIGF